MDFSKLLGSGLIGSTISGLFGIGQQAMANNFNRNEAQKNRNFQSEEAELNRLFQSNEAALQRDWSAAEAEQARDWQEEMYAKYNSLSGKIAQAEHAGVNPMLAVTGNSVSTMSATSSAPSGASAGSVGTPSGSSASAGLVNILGGILDAQRVASEKKVNDALAQKYLAEATGQQITNEQLRDMNAADIMSKLSQVEINDANIKLISSKVLNTDADTKVKGAQLGQIASQIANTDADTKVKAQQIAVMLSEVAINEKSLDVMDAQIKEMLSVVGVNKAEVSKLSQEFRNLVQSHESNEMLRKARQLAEPDGSESDFDKFMYKIVALIKK